MITIFKVKFIWIPQRLKKKHNTFISTGTCCIIGFSCCGDSDKYFPQCEKGDVILALFTSTCISDNALQAITGHTNNDNNLQSKIYMDTPKIKEKT
jgi:hypothetical protein